MVSISDERFLSSDQERIKYNKIILNIKFLVKIEAKNIKS